MQKNALLLISLLSLINTGFYCTPGRKISKQESTKVEVVNTPVNPHATNGVWEPVVLILTTEGEIRVKLYNETPLHRDNFLKLVGQHYYDSLLFHRVIQGFVVQGGDPDSKHAKDGQLLGDGQEDFQIPAEINPKIFHKRGALAAARESDLIDPKRESSSLQFYIVQGRSYTDSLLQIQGKRILKNLTYNKVVNLPENSGILEKFKKFNLEKSDSAEWYSKQIDKQVEKELLTAPKYVFSPEQIKAYTTLGGTPHLDGSYTVFGEVIQGMEIVDKIAKAPRDKNDRPLTNIRIIRMQELKQI